MIDPQLLEWTVGDRMAKARRVAGISREEMAEYLGMSTQALSSYELGRTKAKLVVLRQWALRCGVTLRWLQYGDEPPMPNVVGEEPPPDKPTPKRKRRNAVDNPVNSDGDNQVNIAA